MMTFQEIDRRRIAAGLTRKALYERAGVDGETWRRLSKGTNLPNTGTLIKLTSALDALVAETTGEQANG